MLVLKVKADPTWKKGEPRRIVLDSAETVPFAHVSVPACQLPNIYSTRTEQLSLLLSVSQTQWAEGLQKMYEHANEAGRKRNAQHTMVRRSATTIIRAADHLD